MKSDKQIISDRQKKTSIKGTVWEYEAIAKLTKEGYFVAKSVDPACPFDIVIVDKNGKIQLIDIKTITYYKNLTKEERKKLSDKYIKMIKERTKQLKEYVKESKIPQELK